jgi:hypothetical protein
MSRSIRDISGVLLLFPTLIVGLTRFYVPSMPNIGLLLFCIFFPNFQTDWLLVAFIECTVGIYLARKHYALRTVLS